MSASVEVCLRLTQQQLSARDYTSTACCETGALHQCWDTHRAKLTHKWHKPKQMLKSLFQLIAMYSGQGLGTLQLPLTPSTEAVDAL